MELVSKDQQVGLIIVQPMDNRPETDLLLAEAIDESLRPYRAQGYKYHLIGDFTHVYMGQELAESTASLIPVMILVIGVLILLLTRSW